MKECCTCGMACEPAEYHPYAACLMYLSCHNSETVRTNLDAVRANGAQWEMEAIGKPTVVMNEAGEVVAVTMTDHDSHRILRTVWTRP